jgi:hypothetical protein
VNERDRQLQVFFDQRELELLVEWRIAQVVPDLPRYGGETLTSWQELRELRAYFSEERSK